MAEIATAIGHFRRALEAIWHIPDEAERTKVEMELRVGIGAAYVATQGPGAPEVLETYARAEGCATAWASVRTFSRRSGANGCSGPDEAKLTAHGGFAPG